MIENIFLQSLTHIESEGFPTPVAALAAVPVTPLNRAFPIMTDSSKYLNYLNITLVAHLRNHFL